MRINRRQFTKVGSLGGVAALASFAKPLHAFEPQATAVTLVDAQTGEDIFQYLNRVQSGFDEKAYRNIIGAANPFKEGDAMLGVAAADDSTRGIARQLLSNTILSKVDDHPITQDRLSQLLQQTEARGAQTTTQIRTLGQLKQFLIERDEAAIKTVLPSLSSVVIGCVVKLMSNEELVAVASKIFHPLPNSNIGAKGYLGARVQPNSPTDNLEDIRWQVFDAWAYGVGDVLLGTNPVSSDPESVAAVERTLQEIIEVFGLQDDLPHCVLSHIDVQADVEQRLPGSTALWFQSIAGTDGANQTFDISVEKMLDYARQRKGKFDLYFETGQGADFTNGHGNGFDMVVHESRKYGFARALKYEVEKNKSGTDLKPWVHLNDVAGFIGPEVFRTKEQLVRCCLEDIVMGKLHGLTIGLDVCSTLHMEVSLQDLDWCLDQIMPANPAYLMALPTKIDPMLGYLTTGYHDHLRLRQKFGYRVNDPMWDFFRSIKVIDDQGKPTSNFGDPAWVYFQYRQRKGDVRSEQAIRREARQQIESVRSRGVFITEGHGALVSDIPKTTQRNVDRIYDDAKKSIWAQLTPGFISEVPVSIALSTESEDRNDYILHPSSGEKLHELSALKVQGLRVKHDDQFNVQVVISDGLNALSIMEKNHLKPFLKSLREQLLRDEFKPAPDNIVVNSGRVRAGYQIGEILFAQSKGPRALLHVIGERPGTGHRTFSVYITAPDGQVWSSSGRVDHNITKVVSGIASTALPPVSAAKETVRLLRSLTG
ncbi:ethanolamine ammonia-lyase [Rubripirellula sp.]|nr:ethanolamine ammonia-lyase [Rubripirellula sp.]MDC0317105.1 ethanolamine ammonia-lyase [bacterium]